MTAERPRPAPLPDPAAVLADPTLSRDEKIAKLRRWCHDAREIETANTEGMAGPARTSNLQALHAALRELGANEESDAT